MTLTPHLIFSSCFPFIPRTLPLHPLPRLHLTSLFLQASPHPLHPTCPSPVSPPYLTLTSRTAYTRPHRRYSHLRSCFFRYVASQTPSHLSLSISLDPEISPFIPAITALHLSPHTDLVSLMACASALTQTLSLSWPVPQPSTDLASITSRSSAYTLGAPLTLLITSDLTPSSHALNSTASSSLTPVSNTHCTFPHTRLTGDLTLPFAPSFRCISLSSHTTPYSLAPARHPCLTPVTPNLTVCSRAAHAHSSRGPQLVFHAYPLPHALSPLSAVSLETCL